MFGWHNGHFCKNRQTIDFMKLEIMEVAFQNSKDKSEHFMVKKKILMVMTTWNDHSQSIIRWRAYLLCYKGTSYSVDLDGTTYIDNDHEFFQIYHTINLFFL